MKVIFAIIQIMLIPYIAAAEPKCADSVFRDLKDLGEIDFGSSFDQPSDRKIYIDYREQKERLKNLFAQEKVLDAEVERYSGETKMFFTVTKEYRNCPVPGRDGFSVLEESSAKVEKICQELVTLHSDVNEIDSLGSSVDPSYLRSLKAQETRLAEQIKFYIAEGDEKRKADPRYTVAMQKRKAVRKQISETANPMTTPPDDERILVARAGGWFTYAPEQELLSRLPDGRYDFWAKIREGALPRFDQGELRTAEEELRNFEGRNRPLINAHKKYAEAVRILSSVFSPRIKEYFERQRNANSQSEREYQSQNFERNYAALSSKVWSLRESEQGRIRILNDLKTRYKLSVEVQNGVVKKYTVVAPAWQWQGAYSVDLNSDCSVHSFFPSASPYAYIDHDYCQISTDEVLCKRYQPNNGQNARSTSRPDAATVAQGNR